MSYTMTALHKMNASERRATFSLASIMSLRLLGLFMVLPLFSLYAHNLIGATPLLIGLAMGIYGLTQALLQIPFGILSDHLGRRKIITLGLLLFTVGSIIAALSHTITGMIIGRALQGTGAVGSTIMAMIADLTRPEQRTKAMAIMGITIGFSFTSALMIGPLFASLSGVSGLFWFAALLSIIALLLLYFWVPTPDTSPWQASVEPDRHNFFSLMKMPALLQLNSGIFLLHAIFTASFIVIPITLQNLAGLHGSRQWLLYLPVLLLSFVFILPLITLAEKKSKVKPIFLAAILLLTTAECLFWFFAKYLLISAIGLLLFLIGFSLLEAFLPSLVSSAVPPTRKGTALGIYSCSQFLGIFLGGILGGWLYGQMGSVNVYLFCVILTLVWVIIAIKMNMGDFHHGKRQHQ
jgi:predicted MFS family arabinose efflux permease